jgi:hypothetical protein
MCRQCDRQARLTLLPLLRLQTSSNARSSRAMSTYTSTPSVYGGVPVGGGQPIVPPGGPNRMSSAGGSLRQYDSNTSLLAGRGMFPDEKKVGGADSNMSDSQRQMSELVTVPMLGAECDPISPPVALPLRAIDADRQPLPSVNRAAGRSPSCTTFRAEGARRSARTGATTAGRHLSETRTATAAAAASASGSSSSGQALQPSLCGCALRSYQGRSHGWLTRAPEFRHFSTALLVYFLLPRVRRCVDRFSYLDRLLNGSLALPHSQIPSFAFATKQPFGAVVNATNTTDYISFSRTPANFDFNATLALQADTGATYIPVHTTIDAKLFYIDEEKQVGTGKWNGTMPAKALYDFQMPVRFHYEAINSSDTTWLDFYDACKHIFTGTERSTLLLRLELTLQARGRPGSTQTSTQISNIACPCAQLPSPRACHIKLQLIPSFAPPPDRPGTSSRPTASDGTAPASPLLSLAGGHASTPPCQ